MGEEHFHKELDAHNLWCVRVMKITDQEGEITKNCKIDFRLVYCPSLLNHSICEFLFARCIYFPEAYNVGARLSLWKLVSESPKMFHPIKSVIR